MAVDVQERGVGVSLRRIRGEKCGEVAVGEILVQNTRDGRSKTEAALVHRHS